MQEFLGTQTGKHLVTRAQDEVDELHREFELADPQDIENIRRIQNEINTRRNFFRWLDDAISDADQAYAVTLSNEENINE